MLNKVPYNMALKGASQRLAFSVCLSLVVIVAIIMTIRLSGGLAVVEAAEVGRADIPLLTMPVIEEDTHEDEHGEDFDGEWDGTEGDWQTMLSEPPEGREIILIEDQGTGEMKEHKTTGTNDFYITAMLDGDGYWSLGAGGNSKVEKIASDPGNDRNILMKALEREWELKMRLPDEVIDKLKELEEGYMVAVAVADPVEYYIDYDPPLTINELFDLSESKGVLQYKLEDQYLIIKGFARINIRNDYFYDIISGFKKRVPFVKPRYGTNVHYIYEGNNVVGSTSSYFEEYRLFKQALTQAQRKALEAFVNEGMQGAQSLLGDQHTQKEHLELIAALKKGLAKAETSRQYTKGLLPEELPTVLALAKEMKITAERGWIHMSQIKNAAGDLYGKDTGEAPFLFYSWGNNESAPEEAHLGIKRYSNKTTLSNKNGSFARGVGIALWFSYPLQLTFYVEEIEDVAVLDIDYGDLEPLGTASVAVRVVNNGVSLQEPSLHFSVSGAVKKDFPVRNIVLEPGEQLDVTYSFPLPEVGLLTMTAEVNRDHTFEEVDYENNELTVTTVIGTPIDLPYWAYSRDIVFTLPAAVADLDSPPRGSWIGNASGTLYVQNNTPNPDIYHDFEADDHDGNPAAISISRASSYISRRARINAKLYRPDFGDDPLSNFYADNAADPLQRTGRIETSGSISRKYQYSVSCSRHGSHTYTGTKSTDFSNVYPSYQPIHHAAVYNGVESKDFPFQREFIKKFAKTTTKYKFDLAWEGTHYRLDKEDPGDPPNVRLVRWMSHIDVNGNDDWVYDTPAQYPRTFIGQSTGTVTWGIDESMADFYESDRQAAQNRRTGKGNYDHAVFATDKLLQSYDYPIKSGYYFNPGGTYTCKVETSQYKNTTEPTQEHADLVKAVREAFVYDSSLVYVNKDQKFGKLGNITEKGDPANKHGLLDIQVTSNSLTYEDLYATLDRDGTAAGSSTHELLREVLEGYRESETYGSFTDYKYREQTNKQLYLVEETTIIQFTVGIPIGDSRNLYTHVNMKNGEYLLLARVDAIKYKFEHNNELEMGEFNLDGIKVTVSGSMYDDR